jgi:nucleoside phosphorylase
MECAGVAQACRSFGKPFLGLRALSDNMAGDANADFNAFTSEAADNLWPIVAHILDKY